MILSLLRLMRLYYSLPFAAGFLVILSYRTGGRADWTVHPAATAFFALFCVISGGYVLNDVWDEAVDRINAPRRPLPSGKIPRRAALAWAAVLFISGLVLSVFCGVWFFLGLGLIVLLLTVYDRYSKRMGLLKDFLVAILMISLYPLAFTLLPAARTGRFWVLFIHPIWLFFTALGYEMLKDIRDAEGDAGACAGGIAQYARRRGFGIAARICIVGASLLTVLPWGFGYCRGVYLAAAAGAVPLAIIASHAKSTAAIRCVYAEVFLITAGSMADLMVYGP